LPLCDTKHIENPDTVTGILFHWQVKNAERFQMNMQKTFDAMDPIALGIFPEDVPSTA
jgi:hypothetical protein